MAVSWHGQEVYGAPGVHSDQVGVYKLATDGRHICHPCVIKEPCEKEVLYDRTQIVRQHDSNWVKDQLDGDHRLAKQVKYPFVYCLSFRAALALPERQPIVPDH